jgi:hypothetical protein
MFSTDNYVKVYGSSHCNVVVVLRVWKVSGSNLDAGIVFRNYPMFCKSFIFQQDQCWNSNLK